MHIMNQCYITVKQCMFNALQNANNCIGYKLALYI